MQNGSYAITTETTLTLTTSIVSVVPVCICVHLGRELIILSLAIDYSNLQVALAIIG